MLVPVSSSRFLLRRLGALSPRPSATTLIASSSSSSSSSSSTPTSSHGGGHDDHHETPLHAEEEAIKRQSADYRPGTDSYAYENPWPMLNKGRLDWLFGDGWRRPLARDQGLWMRREWISFGQDDSDEHVDWYWWHGFAFSFAALFATAIVWYGVFLRGDWPHGRDWALREAHFELMRRANEGLPLISKDLIDPKKVERDLASETELKGFAIVI